MAAIDSQRVTFYLFTIVAFCLTQCKTETSSLDTPEPLVEAKKEPESCLFHSDIFFALSKIRRTFDKESLDDRCEIFYDVLLTHWNGPESAKQVAPLSKPELFQLSIQLLNHKHLAFNNTYSALSALKECVAKLPEYQMPCSADSGVADSPPSMAQKLADLESKHELLQRRFKDQNNEIEKLRGELEAERRSKSSLNGREDTPQLLLKDKDDQIKELQWRLQRVRQAAEAAEVLLAKSNALGRSRLEEMIKLYQQASNRAAKTKDELDAARRSLARYEGRQPNNNPSW